MKAFPTPTRADENSFDTGMDLRDYFASKAMQSIITDGKLGALLKHYDYMKKVAEMSYEYADAMIEAKKNERI